MTKLEARDIKPGLYTLWMQTPIDLGEWKLEPVIGVIGLFDNGDAYYCTYEKPWCGRFADTLRWTEPHWNCVDHIEPMPLEGLHLAGMDEMEPFKIGDVVMLKSGGPKMTIVSTVEGIVCAWWSGDGVYNTKTIDSAALRRAT